MDRVDQMTATLIDSKQLLSLYDEAKAMLTETAEYFEGPGNPDQLSLTNENSLAYNEGSKCITARLMEVMAWLFVQRAVVSGEMTNEDAAEKGSRLAKVPEPSVDPTDAIYNLPAEFCSLCKRCGELYNRIDEIDHLIRAPAAGEPH